MYIHLLALELIDGAGGGEVAQTGGAFYPTPAELRQSRRNWAEVDRRKRELRDEIARLFEPAGEAPPPATEPAVAKVIAEARADLVLVERAEDDGAIERALAALASAVQNIVAARAEAQRLQAERDEEDDLEIILLSM